VHFEISHAISHKESSIMFHIHSIKHMLLNENAVLLECIDIQ
jgi:hypothetical protein